MASSTLEAVLPDLEEQNEAIVEIEEDFIDDEFAEEPTEEIIDAFEEDEPVYISFQDDDKRKGPKPPPPPRNARGKQQPRDRKIKRKPPINFKDFQVEAKVNSRTKTLELRAMFSIDKRIQNLRIKAVGNIVEGKKIIKGGLMKVLDASKAPNGKNDVRWSIPLKKLRNGNYHAVVMIRTM